MKQRKTIDINMVSAAMVLVVLSALSAGAAPGAAGHVTTIDAVFDPGSGMVSGTFSLEFSNSTPDTIGEILFITEANAFKHQGTKYAVEQEDEYIFRLLPLLFPEKYASRTGITNVSVNGAAVEATAWSTGSFADSTLTAIQLQRPIAPGGSVEAGLDFETKLRRFDGNAGRTGTFAVSGAWCPLPARFMDGVWAASERLGDLRQTGWPSDFNCAFTLPEGWDIVASGEKSPSAAGEKKRFRAFDAAEYGWFAFDASRFESIAALVGSTRLELIFPHGWSRLQAENARKEIAGILTWLTGRLGAPGFERVTLVAGTGADRGDVYYNLAILPGEIEDWPSCIARFYTRGTAAPTVYSDGWLDTGLAGYLAVEYENETKVPLPPIPFLLGEKTVSGRLAAELSLESRMDEGVMLSEPVDVWDEDFAQSMNRRAIIFFESLRRRIGDEPFRTGLASYFRKHEGNGTQRALKEEMEAAAGGEDLTGFFEQWVDTRDLVNYGIDAVDVEKLEDGEGYETTVSIERKGDMIVPVELEIGFDDGGVGHRVTGGGERLYFETFKSTARPSGVKLDPMDNLFDSDRRDNIHPMPVRFRLAVPGSGGAPLRDSFYFRVFPTLWENHYDGLLPGLHLDLSYMEDFDRTSIWIGHGLDSRRTHYLAEERIPFRGLTALGREGDFFLRFGLLEGRAMAGMEIRKRRESAWWLATRMGLGYLEGNNRSWYGEDTWSDRQDIFLDTGAEIGLKSDILIGSAGFGLKSGLVFLSSAYDYRRLDFCFRLSTSPEFSPLRLRLRSYLGTSTGEVPLQHGFRLGGADAAARLSRFWARSTGVLPENVYYHEPGGGNLRAYTSLESGLEGISAFNVDLDLILMRARSGIPGLSAGLFYDAGRGFGEDIEPDLRNTLTDFGLTASLHGFRFWGITKVWVNLPFYVNYPEYADGGGDNEWVARFSFGVEGSLWSGFGGHE